MLGYIRSAFGDIGLRRKSNHVCNSLHHTDQLTTEFSYTNRLYMDQPDPLWVQIEVKGECNPGISVLLVSKDDQEE